MKLSENTRIAVIGFVYVGLPLAVEFGKKFPTIGLDINTLRVQELRNGIDNTLETETHELAAAVKLTYTTDPEDLKAATVYIVTVPTPIDEYKQPDLTPREKASMTLGKVIKKGDSARFESTV